MGVLTVLAILTVIALAVAFYLDYKATKKRDEEHEAEWQAELKKPRYRIKVITSLGEVLYTGSFQPSHNPGQYSWIMSSKQSAGEVARYAMRKGIQIGDRFLPACSIYDLKVEPKELKLEE